MANVIRDFILVFCSILYEAMPFIVLGATIAGILEVLSPRQAFAFMMAVSVFLLNTLFAPLTLPLRLALASVEAVAVFLILLRCGKLITAVLGLLGRHRIAAIAMSGLLGLIMPMCECGIIPVMRRLLRKGMPLSCCVGYMLAGPIVNIVVLLSTYMAFAGMETAVDASGQLTYQAGGVAMLLMRGGLGWLVAVTTALIVERQYRIYGDELLTPLARPVRAEPTPSREPETSTAIKEAPPTGIQETPPAPAKQPASAANDLDGEGPPKPLFEQLGRVSETALHDFIDITVFLILGALLSALSRAAISPSFADDVSQMSRTRPEAAIAAMMLFAILLCLCSEADAFVAASFTMLRPSAMLAFLTLGPMLDLKLYMMYLRVFRPRLIWTIIPSVVIQVFLYSLIVHYLWETFAPMLHGASPSGP